MPRFEVRERVTYDVVDTAMPESNPLQAVYSDGQIVLNTVSLEEAERAAVAHEQLTGGEPK